MYSIYVVAKACLLSRLSCSYFFSLIAMASKRAILLHDMQGEKGRKLFSRGVTVNVLCGELLSEHKETRFNYKLHRDPAILLLCEEADVAALGTDEFLLLEAIVNPGERLETFKRNLSWGISLREGSVVHVNVPGVNGGGRAVVRYKGKVGNQPGIFFGVELLVSFGALYGYCI